VKKLVLSLLMASFGLLSFAQTNDKMKKHSGETIEVKIIKVNETTINYKYPGEDAEQTIGKYAVASLTYGTSGRVEVISEKIVVSGKDDWEKVIIVTNASEVLGLKKGEEIKGKTSGFYSFNSAGSADKKATRKIKEEAAENGAPFVLLTADKADGFGVKQSIKKGVAYSYK
jgi:hypothetical protein